MITDVPLGRKMFSSFQNNISYLEVILAKLFLNMSQRASCNLLRKFLLQVLISLSNVVDIVQSESES